MKPKTQSISSRFLTTLIVISFSSIAANAGTTWDGGGGVSTNIDDALNWGGVVNSINGTTAAIFGTGGNTATMNVPARFTTLTFNRDDAGGFTVGGASVLSVNISASSSTQNLVVSNTASNGITTINAPLQLYTTGTTGTRLLNIPNAEADPATPSLVITGGIAASTPASTFNLRFGGAGKTKVSGAIVGISGIQQHFNQILSGTAIIAGNQTLGSVAVNVGGTGAGNVASSARIEMGETTADVQSWGTTAINQNSTIAIKSTATMSGGMDIATAASAGSSGGTLEVFGNLSSTTIKIGGTAYSGKLKVSGTATFTGALTTGVTVGSKIVGNDVTNGTLKLSSGSNINGATITPIGGTDPNEDNLNLVKQGAGLLTIGGANTYTGTTTIEAGTLDLTGSIVSATTVQSGGSLNISGTTSGSVLINSGGSVGGEGILNNTLTFGSGASSIAFNPATQTDALTASSVDPSAATIIVVSPTGPVANGTPYTVLKRSTGTFSGADLSKFALGTRGGALSLTGGDTEITLTPSASVAASLIWKGNVNGSWDVASTQNWLNGLSSDRFYSGDEVTFDDTASVFAVAIQGSSVTPGNVAFNNSSNAYTVSGGIAGGGSLTKSGTENVTLSGALSSTGGIDVNAGTLTLSSSNTFTGGINLDGGELRFPGTIAGALNTQAVTLNGGTISFNGTSTITNDTQPIAIPGSGGGIKTDCAANITWRIGGVISGAGNWTKSGTGVLSLGRNSDVGPANDFSGTLTITGGTVDIRHADSLGSTLAGTTIQNAILLMQNFGQTAGTITVDEPLTFSGNAFLTGYCQENKAFTHQYNGNIIVGTDAVVGLSTARNGSNPTPILELNGTSITTGTNSVLSLGLQPASYPAGSAAAAQTVNVGATITGPGAVTCDGTAGSVYTLSDPEYAGNTSVNSGKLVLGADNSANNASTVNIAATGATLELGFSGTDTVDKLFIGGVQQAAGVYKATDNLDSGTPIAQITGSGTLTVTSSPVAGYSAWQTANAPGQTVDQDHDNDGVDNGIEYFMGLSGTAFTSTPGIVADSITWPMGATYSGTYGVDYVIQTSSDLNIWSPASVGAGPGTVAINPGTSVVYTMPAPAGQLFVRLLVNPN